MSTVLFNTNPDFVTFHHGGPPNLLETLAPGLYVLRMSPNGPYLERKDMWNNLMHIIDLKLGEKYFDTHPSLIQQQFIQRLILNAPMITRNILGYKLSEQLKWIYKIIKAFKHDPLIAISILESTPMNLNLDTNDDMNLLLLELSVRKKILSDPTNKVNKIFDDILEQKQPVLPVDPLLDSLFEDPF
jgi:hypothetical protein